VDEIRLRLIERLCRIGEAHLPEIERFVEQLLRNAAAQPSTASTVAAQTKAWPHAPVHRLSPNGTYLVTGATLDKAHLFRSSERLTMLEDRLLSLAAQFGIQLEAWAVFSNHYHFVGHVNGPGESIRDLVARLHSESATEINRLDDCSGRQVWFNFWDTLLTFENSYLSRLNYVHQNAVKHGLAKVAREYPWCSAAWFERVASAAQVKTIYSFKIDRLKIEDDFEPVGVE
jgi:putative transposase